MARTAIVPTVADRTATVTIPALAASDNVNGNNFSNDGNVLLEVKNTAGVSGTFTVEIPGFNSPDGAAITNNGRQYTLVASADVIVGPFPPGVYNQADGTVWLDSSAATIQYRLIRLNR